MLAHVSKKVNFFYNCDKVRVGMPKKEIIAIFGEPYQINKGDSVEVLIFRYREYVGYIRSKTGYIMHYILIQVNLESELVEDFLRRSYKDQYYYIY